MASSLTESTSDMAAMMRRASGLLASLGSLSRSRTNRSPCAEMIIGGFIGMKPSRSPGLLRSIIISIEEIGLSGGGLMVSSRTRRDTRRLSTPSTTCSTVSSAEANIAAPITLAVAEMRSPGGTASSRRSGGSLPRAALPRSHFTPSSGMPRRRRAALTALRSR